MDIVILQRHLHCSPSFRDRCLRSIRFRAGTRSVSPIVHPRPKECIFHEDGILDVDWECAISQSCALHSAPLSRIWRLDFGADTLWLLRRAVLG
jgi:hypothetical protein